MSYVLWMYKATSWKDKAKYFRWKKIPLPLRNSNDTQKMKPKNIAT